MGFTLRSVKVPRVIPAVYQPIFVILERITKIFEHEEILLALFKKKINDEADKFARSFEKGDFFSAGFYFGEICNNLMSETLPPAFKKQNSIFKNKPSSLDEQITGIFKTYGTQLGL
jgi:hypothetical protein